MLWWRLTGAGLCFHFQRREELRRHHLCRRLNHSLAHAGERAAQLKVSRVPYQSAFTLLLKIQVTGPFQKPWCTFAFHDNSVMLRRSHLLKSNCACEDAFDCSD